MLILGGLNFPVSAPGLPPHHGYVCAFENFLTQYRWVFSVLESHQTPAKGREDRRKEDTRPGVDGMWKASQSRNRDSHHLQFPL